MSRASFEEQLRSLSLAVSDLSLEVNRQGRLLNRVLDLLEGQGLDFDLVEVPSATPSSSASHAVAAPEPSPLSGTLGFSPQNPRGEVGFRPQPRTGLTPPAPSALATAPAAGTSSVLSRPSAAVSITESQRRAVAIEIGEFFSRALAGLHRGQSGRSRNPLASKVYVVCRGVEGRVFSPPLLFHSLKAVRTVCEREGQLGESVFCGFPALWEARLACETAELPWPEERHDVSRR